MALSVAPAPRARARVARSTFSDQRPGRRMLTAFVLARTSLLVLTGRVSVDAVCGDHDRHRGEHGYRVGRRVDVVLAGSTDVVTGQRCVLVMGQDDEVAAFIAAREAVTDDVDTASTLTDDGPLQQQRMPSLCLPVQQDCTVGPGAVDRSRGPGPQAPPTVLRPTRSTAVRDHIGWPDSPVHAEEGRPLGVRGTGSTAATQTMSSTLVVAGLIGLLAVCGAAASFVHSVTGPVRRAVCVLQGPEKGRRGHRRRPIILGAAREIGADARIVASDGPTATSGQPPSSAEEFSTPADVVFTDAEQVPAVQAVPAGAGEIAPDMTEAVAAGSPPAASSVATTGYAAARSRALGPTTALWHAVKPDRLVGAVGGSCETAVCGSLVRVSTDQTWPVPARDVCSTCSTVAH